MTVIGCNAKAKCICVLVCLVSLFAGAGEDCARDRFTFQQAEELYHSQQYLLSAVHFSSLRASTCEVALTSRTWLGYSLALNHLSETTEALRTIEKGLAHTRVQEKEKQSLRLLKTWINQEPASELTSDQKARWGMWIARSNKDDFQKILSQSSTQLKNQESLSLLQRDLLQSRSKSPWVSGVASALIPGAGQAYVGTWQTAGLSFVINAVLLGATLEFSRKDLPAAATASAGVFSVTYLGNILSAVQSAHQYNLVARSEVEGKMKDELLPELQF